MRAFALLLTAAIINSGRCVACSSEFFSIFSTRIRLAIYLTRGGRVALGHAEPSLRHHAEVKSAL